MDQTELINVLLEVNIVGYLKSYSRVKVIRIKYEYLKNRITNIK